MSERTSQLITICMLIGALAMVGLALSGTLQMSRWWLKSPQNDRAGP